MRGLLSITVSLLLLSAVVAEAQAFQTPPDIVRTKDGGMVRGSIIELSPGDFVLIALPSGEQRRFAISEVSYAGPKREDPASAPEASELPDFTGHVVRTAPAPEDAAPAAAEAARPLAREPEPLVTVHAPEARLHLRSEQQGLTFMVATAAAAGPAARAAGFERICTAPCEASMPVGSYRMALSPEGAAQRFVESEEPVTVRGPSVLTGTYDSAAGTRTAGWLVLGLGCGAGALISIGSVFTVDHDDISHLEDTLVLSLAGVGVSIASVVVGLVLGATSDEAHIRVQPAGP